MLLGTVYSGEVKLIGVRLVFGFAMMLKPFEELRNIILGKWFVLIPKQAQL